MGMDFESVCSSISLLGSQIRALSDHSSLMEYLAVVREGYDLRTTGVVDIINGLVRQTNPAAGVGSHLPNLTTTAFPALGNNLPMWAAACSSLVAHIPSTAVTAIYQSTRLAPQRRLALALCGPGRSSVTRDAAMALFDGQFETAIQLLLKSKSTDWLQALLKKYAEQRSCR